MGEARSACYASSRVWYGRSIAGGAHVKAFTFMTCISCFAGLELDEATLFSAVIKEAGLPEPPVSSNVNVVELGKLKPRLLICNLDAVTVDPLELLRQVRFVLSQCIIMVYTGVIEPQWGVACHLAGASGLLAKGSLRKELAAGVRVAMRFGCYTDPRFNAVIKKAI